MSYNRIFALAVAAALVGAASAHAATVDLKFTGVNPGDNENVSFNGGSSYINSGGEVNTGSYDWAVSNNGVPSLITGSTLTTFCIEGTQYISVGQKPTYTVLGPGQGAYTSVFNNNALVTSFFDQYYDLLSGAPSAQKNNYYAAFQLAVWELVYDGLTDKPLLTDNAGDSSRWYTTGNFEIAHTSSVAPTGAGKVDFSATEITMAEGWLNGFTNTNTGEYSIYQLSNYTDPTHYQDQIFAVKQSGTIPGTPLPAALPGGLMLMGALSAGAVARRKKANRSSI